MKLISSHAVISILVRDQDEALRFYTEKLGLEKRSDIVYGPGLRLLTVAAGGQRKPELALACPDKAMHGEQRIKEIMARVGRRSPWIFVTHNCWQKYEQLHALGVGFVRTPTSQNYGLEAVFVDLDGNAFSLLEASPEVLPLLKKHGVGAIRTAA